MKLPSLATALMLVGLTSGCLQASQKARTQLRIKEKGDLFSRLTARQQNNILGGAVERGYSMDMVYMSLGRPGRIVTSADGVRAMWVYVDEFSNAPVRTSFNNPNSSHYQTGYTAPGAPPVAGRAPRWMQPGSAGDPSQSLEMPEITTRSTCLFFRDGRLVEIKSEANVGGRKTDVALDR